jgi:hypothetical protein
LKNGNGTAAAKAKALEPERAITPAEAWAMVNELRISVEHSPKTETWIATFRNDEKYIYLPVGASTAFDAVKELLAQIGVEVAHG